MEPTGSEVAVLRVYVAWVVFFMHSLRYVPLGLSLREVRSGTPCVPFALCSIIGSNGLVLRRP